MYEGVRESSPYACYSICEGKQHNGYRRPSWAGTEELYYGYSAASHAHIIMGDKVSDFPPGSDVGRYTTEDLRHGERQ